MKCKKLACGLLAAALAFSFISAPPMKDVQAESVKGFVREYTYDTGTGNEIYANMTLMKEVTDVQLDSYQDVTQTYDIYIPTSAVNSLKGHEGINIGITPTLKIRVPQKKFWVFFGYGINLRYDESGTLSCFASDIGHADEGGETIDNPDFAKITTVGDFTKISVKDAPLGKMGTMYGDVDGTDADSEDATNLLVAGSYKVLEPDMVVAFSGDGERYSTSFPVLWTNESVSVKGKPVLTADYDTDKGEYADSIGGEGEESKALYAQSVNTSFTAPASAKVIAGKSVAVNARPHFETYVDSIKSSNSKIATASYTNGKLNVKGIKKGTAVITVTSLGIARKIKVEVGGKAFTVAKTKASVKKGKKITIKVSPVYDSDKVTVTSSNKKIASASYKKGVITIKGVKKGKATITAKSGKTTKKIAVNVK